MAIQMVVARDRTSAELPTADVAGAGWPRRPLAFCLALCTMAIPSLGFNGIGAGIALLLLAALFAVASAASSDRAERMTVLHWLPVGGAFALLGATMLGMAATFITPAWGERSTSLLSWYLLTAIPAAIAAIRGRRIQLARDASDVIATSTPFLLVASATVLLPFEVWARIVTAGTDFPRHVILVLQTADAGFLSYEENPYPRSAHAAIALVHTATGGTTFGEAWRATESLLLITMALTVAGSALLARRAMELLDGRAVIARFVVPNLIVILLLAGPLISGLVAAGFLTSVEAALIMTAAALLFLDGSRAPTTACAVACVLLTALLAHAWALLLPVIALPSAWIALRVARRPGGLLPVSMATAVAIATSAPVIASTLQQVGLSAVATEGGTPLPDIGIVWLVIVLMACLCVAIIGRGRSASIAQAFMLFILGLMLTLLFLASVSDGTTEGSYYLIKSAWTPLPVLIGLAVPATAWLLIHQGRRVRVAVLLALAAMAAATVPSSAAAARTMTGGGEPALFVPLAERLLLMDSELDGPRPEVFVWGLSPHLDTPAAGQRPSGFIDYVAQSAMYMAGHPLPRENTDETILGHDPVGACRYLQDNPAVLRVTGPYPQGPLNWLAESGCPESVVSPETWTSVAFGPEWFRGTRFEGQEFGDSYATWAESSMPAER